MFTVTFSHDSQIMEIIFTKRKIKKKTNWDLQWSTIEKQKWLNYWNIQNDQISKIICWLKENRYRKVYMYNSIYMKKARMIYNGTTQIHGYIRTCKNWLGVKGNFLQGWNVLCLEKDMWITLMFACVKYRQNVKWDWYVHCTV